MATFSAFSAWACAIALAVVATLAPAAHAQIFDVPPIPQSRLAGISAAFGTVVGNQAAAPADVVATPTPQPGELLFDVVFARADVLDLRRTLISRGADEADGVLLPSQLLLGPQQYNAVVVRLLDKITTDLETRTVPIGGETSFGTLTMRVDACLKNPTNQRPESSAFLKIDERLEGEPVQTRFSGWMFASSPALNALDHAIYDVWVIDCENVQLSQPAPATEDLRG